MFLEILTPVKKVFEGDVTLIKVPGSGGSFEVMDKHAPIISTLKDGLVKVITSTNDVIHFEAKGGVIQVMDDKAILLVQSLQSK
jgi:F-type H+-transporting ATPase subunit epsilon